MSTRLERSENMRQLARMLPPWHEPADTWPTSQALSEALGASTETLWQRLASMLRAGLVVRTRDRRDRAAAWPYRYALTEKGVKELRG